MRPDPAATSFVPAAYQRLDVGAGAPCLERVPGLSPVLSRLGKTAWPTARAQRPSVSGRYSYPESTTAGMRAHEPSTPQKLLAISKAPHLSPAHPPPFSAGRLLRLRPQSHYLLEHGPMWRRERLATALATQACTSPVRPGLERQNQPCHTTLIRCQALWWASRGGGGGPNPGVLHGLGGPCTW